jgi:hypothetical protein
VRTRDVVPTQYFDRSPALLKKGSARPGSLTAMDRLICKKSVNIVLQDFHVIVPLAAQHPDREARDIEQF